MSVQFTAGKFRYTLASGAPAAGYRLYTFVSGTTTFKAVYTTSALSSSVSYTTDGSGLKYATLNSNGETPAWLGTGSYSMRLTDASGVTVWTVDGIAEEGATALVSALQTDLASSVDGAKGAGMIGASVSLGYSSGTVGAMLTGVDQVKDIRSTRLLVGSGSFNANMVTGDQPHLFEIVNDNSTNQCFSMSAYGSATNGNNMHFNRYNGTSASPSAVTNGEYFKSEGYRGWDGSGSLSQSYAAHQVMATQDWTSTNHGIKFHWELAKTNGATRYQAMDLYAGASDNVILKLGDTSTLLSRIMAAGTTSGQQVHGSEDQAGARVTYFGSAYTSTPSQVLSEALKHEFKDIYGTRHLQIDCTNSSVTIGSLPGTARLNVTGAGTAAVAQFKNATDTGMVYLGAANLTPATGENAANAMLYVRKDGSTNRSINAAGTINASGADYAEYMHRADDCADVKKGQIVGIDANGLITDKWSKAVTFAVKSTSPSYVGGDDWFTESPPEMPQLVVPKYTGPAAPEPAGENATDEEKLAYSRAFADYSIACQAWKASCDLERQIYESATLVAWRSQLATFNARLELARAKVDRIAFCGQVPVNFVGTVPGDYIVPVEGPDDSISAMAVYAPTFDQYREAVGRVIATEPDGRARIIVKVA